MSAEDTASMSGTAPSTSFRAGLIQMRTGRDVARNLEYATRLIREAAGQGAQYVQTPEFTVLMEATSREWFAGTKPEEGNPAVAQLSQLARELSLWLHLGSMSVLLPSGKIANRSYLFSPDGLIAAQYDKIHMFDAAPGGGESYRESKHFQAGSRAVVADLPWGKLGLTICYDLRFPSLYRSLAQAGATILAVPSAFIQQTGAAHWHALVRARAIETGSYVLAAAQGGRHESGRETFGHSIAVSPWGQIIAEAGDGIQPSVILADIVSSEVDDARRQMPSLGHDRHFDVARVTGLEGTGRTP
jgi:predicted amidohydrolase